MKKIMFNDKFGLTDAVLKGNKTMTRRIIKQEVDCARHFNPKFCPEGYDPKTFYRDYHGMCRLLDSDGEYIMPTYRIDEVVAVAQSYKDLGYSPTTIQRGRCVRKSIHGDNPGWTDDMIGQIGDWYIDQLAGWNNKMFVHAAMCQHKIRITNIKVERLQDISDGDDCLKEGVWIDSHREVIDDNIYTVDVFGKHYCQWHFHSAREAFSFLIDKVYGKGTFENNPWVFAYSFELVK